jgi:hypothetical protein
MLSKDLEYYNEDLDKKQKIYETFLSKNFKVEIKNNSYILYKVENTEKSLNENRINNYVYKINSEAYKNKKIELMEKINNDWKIYNDQDYKFLISDIKYLFMNSLKIDVDSPIENDVILYFERQKTLLVGLIISIISLLIVIFNIIRLKNGKN